MFRPVRWLFWVVLALAAAFALSACGSEAGTEQTEVVDAVAITIEDGEVTPAGKRVKVALGKDLTIRVSSDVAGELHIHSKPEQSVHFEAGESEHVVNFDKPGIVQAELHDPELVVVEFEVS